MKFFVQHFDQIDSTNIYLKQHVNELPTYQVVCAKEQTNGRGRLGRQFMSPMNGLYFSILLRPQSVEKALLIPFVSGLSVACAIEKLLPCSPVLKWPNDVLLHQKKICGMLAEGVGEAVIMGIGVNLSASRSYFDAQNLFHVSSLAEETGQTPDRLELLSAILTQMEYWLSQKSDALMAAYKKRCVTLKKSVTTSTGLCGTAVDISSKGELVLREANGQEHFLNSGEVSISGMY